MSAERFAMSLFLVLGICCSKPMTMPVIAQVDISKMEGSWIEIARMPIFAQKTSEYGWQDHYQLQADGTILVTGSYRKGGPDGPWKSVHGKVRIPDSREPGKWSVQFVWPFSADQWIVDLDTNYQWVFFGHPNRRWLWIMTRSGSIDPKLLESLITKAKTLGYDTSQIIFDTPWSEIAPR
ncbi:MAG: lipocalin family protein [Holophagaceae bacterium]|jgi:apolipoprotein D and lipocalin family protein